MEEQYKQLVFNPYGDKFEESGYNDYDMWIKDKCHVYGEVIPRLHPGNVNNYNISC